MDITAIDIAPEMVSRARVIVGTGARFEACAFEDLQAPDESFDLVVRSRPASTDAKVAVATGRFCDQIVQTHERRLTLAPDDVAAVERTRATVPDYEPDVRRRYDRERRRSAAEVVDDGR